MVYGDFMLTRAEHGDDPRRKKLDCRYQPRNNQIKLQYEAPPSWHAEETHSTKRRRTPLSLGPLLCISERWISAVRKELCRTPMIQAHRRPLPLGGLFSQRASGIATARERPPGLPLRLAAGVRKEGTSFSQAKSPRHPTVRPASPSPVCVCVCEISHRVLGRLGLDLGDHEKEKKTKGKKRKMIVPGR